ncbi:MAG: TRAP transporter small permease subunit [Rhodobacteraceae bacterium]|nr:TRAP transporter small permease subunit [Paracoccaceae bacterium]
MNRLTRIAEAIAATALAAIFIVFLLQIFTRYSGKLSQWMPVENLSLWMSEIEPLRERDHVAFDILYQAAPPRLRKIMTILGAIILIAVMLISLPATWQAIMANRLMELKKLQTLRLPITGDKIAIKWLFFPYLVLMAILIIRSCSRIFLELRTNNQNTEVSIWGFPGRILQSRAKRWFSDYSTAFCY